MFDRNRKLTREFFVSTMKLMRLVAHSTTPMTAENKFATMLQFQALHILRHQPNITVGELSLQLHTTSGGIAQLITRLEKAGWITRTVDPNDRRVIHISLTLSGRLEFRRRRHGRIRKFASLLTLIPEEDLRELIRIQNNLIQKLEEQKA